MNKGLKTLQVANTLHAELKTEASRRQMKLLPFTATVLKAGLASLAKEPTDKTRK
jgi:hypothetical protein